MKINISHTIHFKELIIIMTQYINLIVAFSNVAGIIKFYNNYDIINVTMIIASILMHLSETKHKLNGIYPFNKYSYIFLWFDRIMAYIVTIIVFNNVYIKWHNISYYDLLYGLFGLFMMTLSELMIIDQYMMYILTHCLWHFMAYDFYYKMLVL